MDIGSSDELSERQQARARLEPRDASSRTGAVAPSPPSAAPEARAHASGCSWSLGFPAAMSLRCIGAHRAEPEEVSSSSDGLNPTLTRIECQGASLRPSPGFNRVIARMTWSWYPPKGR